MVESWIKVIPCQMNTDNTWQFVLHGFCQKSYKTGNGNLRHNMPNEKKDIGG